MARCAWEGDVSTDPTVAGNWSTAAVPAAADDVVFDGTASDDCIGGDLTANQVATVTIADDCIINIGVSAADALDFDCSGVVQDRAQSGTRYLNIKNSTSWNVYGGGIISIDGIDNDALNIDARDGTVTVGPILATPAEFDTTITIKSGTIDLLYVTDQAAAATDLTMHGGTATCESALATVRQTGGKLYHNEGVMAAYYGDGGTCYYNSGGTLTLAEVDVGGTLDFAYDFRPVTVTTARIKRGTVWDIYGRVTWTNAVETPDCWISDCTVNFGFNKKYTVAGI